MNDVEDETDWLPIRRAMENKIDATSLRELSRELGVVSASGPQKFLDGATPKQKGQVYLEWFLKEGPRWGGDDDVLNAAIEVVVRHSHRDRRGEVRRYVEDVTGISTR